MLVPTNPLLFHFTAFKNLESILKCASLKSVNVLRAEKIIPTNIAYSHIQKRRDDKCVPGTINNLHDFIPFLFAPRSPMLYAIIGGKVAEAEETDQNNLIYFVTNVKNVSDMEFWFTDIHAVLDYANFYNSIEDMDKIDWFVINGDTSEGMLDGYCKYFTPNKRVNGILAPYDRYARRQETRQAEFLIRNELPLEKIIKIVVKSETMLHKVKDLLRKYNRLDISVEIKIGWYF